MITSKASNCVDHSSIVHIGPNAKNSSNDEAKKTEVSPSLSPGELSIDFHVAEKLLVPWEPTILDSSHSFAKLRIAAGSSDEVRDATSAWDAIRSCGCVVPR